MNVYVIYMNIFYWKPSQISEAYKANSQISAPRTSVSMLNIIVSAVI